MPKIPKERRLELAEIASNLNRNIPIKRKVKIVKFGSQFISEGISKTNNGEDVIPTKRYEIEGEETVDHLKYLNKAYISGGWDAVLNYIRNKRNQSKKFKKG